ncbi:MAG TPA: DNA-primase RepB domain-containing protein [Gemmatimonadales bacterium]|nr:DNA-primase RepB domain-containing protein [Gemmatimonadales bacterium]
MTSVVRRTPLVPRVDRAAPLQFLRTAYDADDWIAVFLKRYDTGEALQRVGPVTLFQQPNVQAWLRLMNARHFNLFVSVNAVTPGRRSRTREAVCAIRHVFIDVDHDGRGVLAAINARRDLPTPSYVLHSSPDRVHVFWRATGFTTSAAEHLQKYLARELGADPAATPCSQTSRLAGFLNYKYAPLVLVRAKYGRTTRVYTPADFPTPPAHAARRGLSVTSAPRHSADVVERARRYLAALPPAVTGQHGDSATFRACCRLVRGFCLTDADALALITEWNTRCAPPWTERELADKIRRARRYGREPLGGLLEARP